MPVVLQGRQTRSLGVINPGNLATPGMLSDLEEIGAPATDAIPLDYLVMFVEYILCVSIETCIKEIDVTAVPSRGA
jgi:hypothetical protein